MERDIVVEMAPLTQTLQVLVPVIACNMVEVRDGEDDANGPRLNEDHASSPAGRSRHGPPTLRQNIAPEPVIVSTVSPFGFPHCSQRSLARSRIRSLVARQAGPR